MVIPFGDNGMKARRTRIIRSFSLRPSDLDLLCQGKERVKKYLPDAKESELVRLALEVLTLAPEGLLRRVVSTFERVEGGRPPVEKSASVADFWDDFFLLEDKGRLQRLAFFEELEMLREEGPRGEPEVEARIETLCRYFGMVYRENE